MDVSLTAKETDTRLFNAEKSLVGYLHATVQSNGPGII